MPPLIWVDYCIVGIIGVSGLIGLIRGLVREVFSLAAWGAAIWVGIRFSPQVAVYFEQSIPLPSARFAVAFGVLFVACLMISGVLGFLLAKLVEGTGLSGTDRLLGMIFGIGRGVLVVSVLILLAGVTPLPQDPWWKESKLIPPFQSLAYWLREQIPADLSGPMKFPSVFQR